MTEMIMFTVDGLQFTVDYTVGGNEWLASISSVNRKL